MLEENLNYFPFINIEKCYYKCYLRNLTKNMMFHLDF